MQPTVADSQWLPPSPPKNPHLKTKDFESTTIFMDNFYSNISMVESWRFIFSTTPKYDCIDLSHCLLYVPGRQQKPTVCAPAQSCLDNLSDWTTKELGVKTEAPCSNFTETGLH